MIQTFIKSIFIHDSIAAKIENEMEYPGQVKVTVIREVRKISYAQ